MTPDFLTRLEHQLMTAAERELRASPRHRRAAALRGGSRRALVAVPVAAVALLLAAVGGGALLLGGEEERAPGGPPTGSTAPRPPVRTVPSAATPIRPFEREGTTGTTGRGAAGFPQQQVNLRPTRGGQALGFALVAEGGLALQVEGLPEGKRYGVYLYNSEDDALPLGFAAYDRKTRRAAGAITTLPAGASRYDSVVVTRQRGTSLDAVGAILLRGRLRR